MGGRDLVGYNYLANSDIENGYTWVSPNVKGWMTRKRFDERFRHGPVLCDLMQAKGALGPPLEIHEWGWQSYSSAAHPKSDGSPSGGNFLFEDGHFDWFDFSKVKPGYTSNGPWINYYDISDHVG